MEFGGPYYLAAAIFLKIVQGIANKQVCSAFIIFRLKQPEPAYLSGAFFPVVIIYESSYPPYRSPFPVSCKILYLCVVKIWITGYEPRYPVGGGIKVGKLLKEKRKYLPGIRAPVPFYMIGDGGKLLYPVQAQGV